jgi:RNA polymerase I-specific transcription initiation factor RRN6
MQTMGKTTKRPPKVAQSQMKWAIRTRPETFPANVIASALAKTSATQTDYPLSYGQLVAVGYAVDADHQIEHRSRPIIATPCGEAGHVLRLIRPQAEHRGWRKQSSVKLPLLDAASGDIAYWVGTGGTIRQITFSSDGHGSGNWLAALQDSMITIFRPTYHKQPVHAAIPTGYDKQYPPSRLSVNPAAVLKSELCGFRRHADMSFNPFYTRQFGVVNDSGRWSIWDIEGRMRKNSALGLVSGKSGGIYDDFVPNPREKSLDTMDGWHRILWVTNVSTIVVCNRGHIAAFDVKSAPSRLPSLGPLLTRANDWILDIKRSPMDSSQMFILTTSRVFWVEVIAAGGKKDGHEAGIRVILSYRHFRDASDETLSLTVLLEDDGKGPQIKHGILLTI